MRIVLCVLALLVLPACTSTGGTAFVEHPDTPHDRYEFSQIHMGVRANIIIYSDDERKANDAARAAFAEVARLDSIMSDYRVDSELNRLSDSAGHGWVPISEDLFHVLAVSQHIAMLTDGAFDVTVGPCTQLWRQMRKTGTLPPPGEFARAHALVDYTQLHLDEETQSARLTTLGMRLDLGGIAKGYAVDRASMVLMKQDCSYHLVALAGDIRAGFGPPEKSGWRIAIDPRAVSDTTDKNRPYLVLQNNAISTSGDINQFIEIDGRRYSHIIDPRTGIGSPNRTSATVATTLATYTDPLATVCTLLNGPEAISLIEQLDAIAARIEILDDRGKSWVKTTSRWPTDPDNPPMMELKKAEALDAPRPNVP